MTLYNLIDTVTETTQAKVHLLETAWKATHNESIGVALDKAYAMHDAMMTIFESVEC